MNELQFFCQNRYLYVFPSVYPPLNSYATPIIFAGHSDAIGTDEEDGIFAGPHIGADFSGIEVSLEGSSFILHQLAPQGRWPENNTVSIAGEADASAVQKYFSANTRAPP